jgi:hypothetical protein
MKQINKHLIFPAAILSMIGFASCKKTWLDVNQDSNRVTDANVTAGLIFPAAANEVGQLAVGSTSLQEWMGYWAPNGGFVPQQNVISYNIDFTFGDGLFQSYYNTLFDLHQVQVKGLASGDTDLAAASGILSAKLFQEVTDIFGDVPYSQAFQTDQFTTPKYDAAQEIYNALQLRLDTAIMYLNTYAPSNAFAEADIINHGDVTRWIKFANTLKLRLLIRQSEVPGFDPSPEIAKIANGGNVIDNILGPGESVSVNPGYVNDVNKQSPFYGAHGWTPSGVQSDQATNANNYIMTILSNANDPRIGRFFFPAGFDPANGFVGNVFGDPIGTLAQASSSSYFGPALVGELDPNLVGLGYSKDQFIYPSYESMFLYAEAVARGWIPGDANSDLAAAITESFVWLGVPDAATAAASYIAANPSTTTMGSANTPSDRDRIVAFQKYIANTGIDPQESFFDQNRLHFLTDNSYISTLPTKISNVIPLRYLYPQSEYTTNGVNTPKQVAGDEFTKKLFWEP